MMKPLQTQIRMMTIVELLMERRAFVDRVKELNKQIYEAKIEQQLCENTIRELSEELEFRNR